MGKNIILILLNRLSDIFIETDIKIRFKNIEIQKKLVLFFNRN